MASTSPDNILTPDAGDQYALVQDLGVMADSVQDALTNLQGRANSYIGTTTQMNAFTTAPAGTQWFNTTTSMDYIRLSGVWYPRAQRGSATGLSAPVETNSAAVITFATPFPRPPMVVVNSTTVNNRVTMDARNASTTGFVLVSGSKNGIDITGATADWSAYLV